MKRKIVFFIILIFLLLNCAGSNGTYFTLIPIEKEIELGKIYIFPSIDQYEGLYPEKEVQKYISSIGYKLSSYTSRKLPYKFYIVNSSQINAFALPGGPVLITRGLFLILDNESQLIGVLAHELGHINYRHHVKILEKNIALGLLLQIGSVFLPQNLTGELLFNLGKISVALLRLKFSRDQEREADKFAVLLAIKTGYSPQGMLEVLQKFKKMEKTHPPEWLSTHPLPETRIKELKIYLSTLKPSGYLIKDTQKFHKIKKLVLKTKKSYEYVDKGKKVFKKEKFDIAEKLFLKAVKLYPKNTVAHTYLSFIYLKKKNLQKAKKHIDMAIKYDPQFYTANLLGGIIYFELNNLSEALALFEKSKELIPYKGVSYYYIGRIYEKRKNYDLAKNYYKKALELGPKDSKWYKDCQNRYNRLIYLNDNRPFTF